jgi:hypothetical protein
MIPPVFLFLLRCEVLVGLFHDEFSSKDAERALNAMEIFKVYIYCTAVLVTNAANYLRPLPPPAWSYGWGTTERQLRNESA